MATSLITTTVVTRIELVADLEITEYDKAGILKATYVESGTRKSAKRVDFIVRATTTSFLKQQSKWLIFCTATKKW